MRLSSSFLHCQGMSDFIPSYVPHLFPHSSLSPWSFPSFPGVLPLPVAPPSPSSSPSHPFSPSFPSPSPPHSPGSFLPWHCLPPILSSFLLVCLPAFLRSVCPLSHLPCFPLSLFCYFPRFSYSQRIQDFNHFTEWLDLITGKKYKLKVWVKKLLSLSVWHYLTNTSFNPIRCYNRTTFFSFQFYRFPQVTTERFVQISKKWLFIYACCALDERSYLQKAFMTILFSGGEGLTTVLMDYNNLTSNSFEKCSKMFLISLFTVFLSLLPF